MTKTPAEQEATRKWLTLRALTAGLVAGIIASIIAGLLVGPIGYFVGFIVGVMIGFATTRAVGRSREEQAGQR